ncbi:MAG: M48 family metallopeptidase [Flavobacteriales bacterium]|nr:M48 family metallopeptidase [Flavobacteriales bacterium]
MKVLRIQDLEIKLKKSFKAKNISIKIKPFEGVLVTVPMLVSFKIAEDFVKTKINWINKNLDKVQKQEQLHTFFSANNSFKTRSHLVNIISTELSKNTVHIENSNVKVLISKKLSISSEENQIYIRNIILEIWRKEAKEYLPKRVEALAIDHDFNYQKLTIKNTKTRWGSCSFDNNINLSLHLMRISNELIDYVILHELVHTKVKNHSSKFWETLEKHCPNSKILDKELKKYSLRIF